MSQKMTKKVMHRVPSRRRRLANDAPIEFVPLFAGKEIPQVIEDVGPYTVWSTVLLSEMPEKSTEDQLREHSRRDSGARFFRYSIGGQVPGAYRQLAATRLETNLNVPNQFVDEHMSVESIDLVIPRVSLAAYQINPSGGVYLVSEQDVMSLAAEASLSFYCGGDKPFAESPLAHRQVVNVHDVPKDPTFETILGHAGGWIVRFAEFGKNTPLPIGRIEKFWGELVFMHSYPKFGRHCYNPAVIATAMILNGERRRRAQ